MTARLDKPVPITVELASGTWSEPIATSSLRRGDIVVDGIGATAQDRHVVIFDRWVDSTRRAHVAYGQRGGHGTDWRSLTHGLEASSRYKARRLKNVIDK
ncbi:hypothetical protein [Lentzea sp. CC55]|uniref:hypothetical protein n=1 Tax=Lentzea sp. CC55 TaxID=2884909 RepID=UPI001F1C24B3|nr:hypothetical protein [Lentzea sp. CC55]MCG8927165.1 hypothetical protein [Lentzea sp. CC55]